MRLVVDTNVLVAALLHPERKPSLALAALVARRERVLYDERIVDEWREVLARPKFRRADPARGAALVDALLAVGERLVDVPRLDADLVDADDRPFVEVALAGRADAVVTGNGKHYPTNLGFEVVGPTALLARFEAL